MIKSLFQNIMVAINGSDASIAAAKYAILMAKLYRCKVSAVYVVDTATIKYLTIGNFFVQEESAEYEKSLEETGERYLSYFEDLAKAKGVRVERILRRGSVWSEIVTAADEKGIDCILLGAYEKQKSASDIISRQYREITLHAHCSVLLVKEPAIDQLYKLA